MRRLLDGVVGRFVGVTTGENIMGGLYTAACLSVYITTSPRVTGGNYITRWLKGLV